MLSKELRELAPWIYCGLVVGEPEHEYPRWGRHKLIYFINGFVSIGDVATPAVIVQLVGAEQRWWEPVINRAREQRKACLRKRSRSAKTRTRSKSSR